MHTGWPNYTAAKIAASALSDQGFEAYIVGGAVRDMLLGITPKDFDLVTNATPQEVLKIKDFKKSDFKDTAQAYGVTRVVVEVKDDSGQKDIELEIATYRRDIEAHLGRKQTKVAFSHLEDDVKRRDFTVNAIALDPATDQLTDLVEGLHDIEHRLVRFIGDPATRIKEDPLRILRAIRLKNQLGFGYDQSTYLALKKAITDGDLSEIAVDRIKFELTRMITDRHRKFALVDLDELGALKILLPEVAAQKGVPQPEKIHAEGDVWSHCLLTMQYLPEIINPRLAWAALLHDIGKVETVKSKVETGDRIRFSSHHAKGSDLTRHLLKRLRFGKSFRDDVAWLVHYHLSIDDLPHMRPNRAKQMMSHPAFADLMELHKADAHAAWSVDESGNLDDGPADFSQIENIWRKFQDQKYQRPPSLKHDLDIDGKWLMEEFDIDKGPELGHILKKLEEAYLDGEIKTKKQAADMVKIILKEKNP